MGMKSVGIARGMKGIGRVRKRRFRPRISQRVNKTRPVHPRGYTLLERKKRRRTLIVSIALFALIILFSYVPLLSEWYMRVVYPGVATLLSSFSGLFSFSLYDLFLIGAVLWLLVIIVLAIVRRSGFVRFLFSLLRFVTVLVAWFYFSWGIAYFRQDFYTRCEVEEVAYDSEGFHDFVTWFIEHANQSYLDFAGTGGAETGKIGVTNGNSVIDLAGTGGAETGKHSGKGWGSGMKEQGGIGGRGGIDKKAIQAELESVYQKLHEQLRLAFPNGKRRAKPMMFEPFHTKTGVSGYFGPFFNEVHVNHYSLDFTYPFTLAHEMAHQFGIGLESEANLYAFIVCAASDDKQVRYSAYVSTLGYVLNDARRILPDEYKEIYQSVRPEILNHLKQNREHWLAARSAPLSNAQDKVYDAYLKTNKVSTGQVNYSEVVGLLVSSYNNFSRFW
ncbi:MAG TPA: DUF3810 domain-containing protein [Bacteroidales bacterium]|nr:DUF3810 domain-containing protein [Bacteroidales bacterium]